jgi:hypothetical protein
MLLDALTIFFLVGGSLLLWLNIRRQPSQVILTKLDHNGRWPIARPSLEDLARELAAEKAPDVGDFDSDVIPANTLCPDRPEAELPRRELPKFKDRKGAISFAMAGAAGPAENDLTSNCSPRRLSESAANTINSLRLPSLTELVRPTASRAGNGSNSSLKDRDFRPRPQALIRWRAEDLARESSLVLRQFGGRSLPRRRLR